MDLAHVTFGNARRAVLSIWLIRPRVGHQPTQISTTMGLVTMHTTNRATPRALLALAATALLATGCQNMSEREKGTATGAGIGAILGAAIGSNSGNAGKGAVIGAAGGAVVGNLWSKHMEDKRKAMEKAAKKQPGQLPFFVPWVMHEMPSHAIPRIKAFAGRPLFVVWKLFRSRFERQEAQAFRYV